MKRASTIGMALLSAGIHALGSSFMGGSWWSLAGITGGIKSPRPGSRSGWKWQSDTPKHPTIYGQMALDAAAERRERRADKRRWADYLDRADCRPPTLGEAIRRERRQRLKTRATG